MLSGSVSQDNETAEGFGIFQQVTVDAKACTENYN